MGSRNDPNSPLEELASLCARLESKKGKAFSKESIRVAATRTRFAIRLVERLFFRKNCF
ncbi:hypothetical protein MPNT_510005 [Candidatus Methylacidithermus pantelleriae]|uniref:Uncharacterized protein n=1 Tax=Candidatus Methylacidithermus pantelleriae TaxID=2744239 RepID=A0A8J2BKM5_9BACT|nr:hypothetical protein MPNT_510005 [Candidatus Methylacidithermus pantelleriae]